MNDDREAQDVAISDARECLVYAYIGGDATEIAAAKAKLREAQEMVAAVCTCDRTPYRMGDWRTVAVAIDIDPECPMHDEKDANAKRP